MNRKLYVNNIPWSATNNDLKTWIREQGFAVDDVKIIMSPEDGRSRGFGFVTFGTEEDAGRALKILDGADYLGRTLHVAEALQKRSGDRSSESERRFDSRGQGRPGNDRPSGGGKRGGRRGRESGEYDRDE